MPKTIYKEAKDDSGAKVRKKVKADSIIFVDPKGDEWIVSFSMGDGITVDLVRKSTGGPMYVLPRSPVEVKFK